MKKYLMLLSFVLACGCLGERTVEPNYSSTTLQPKTETATSSNACPACAFGPRVYTRSASAPTTVSSTFAADPAADYIIDIDDGGSVGADESVTVNGVVILAPRTTADVGTRHVRRAVTLQALNSIKVKQVGEVGSRLSIRLIGGVKSVGIEGGVIRFPGGTVSLVVPPGALKFASTIQIQLEANALAATDLYSIEGPTVTLLPEGQSFELPVELKIKYSGPSTESEPHRIYQFDAASHSLLRVPSVDVSGVSTVTAHLRHFSSYVPLKYLASSLFRSKVNISYYLDASNAPKSGSTTSLELWDDLDRAIGQWAVPLRGKNLNFVRANDPASADILVRFGISPCPGNPIGLTWGTFKLLVLDDVAIECIGGGYTSIQSVITLNSGFEWYSSAAILRDGLFPKHMTVEKRSFESLVSHEFGHSLGLAHFEAKKCEAWSADLFDSDCNAPPTMAIMGDNAAPIALACSDLTALDALWTLKPGRATRCADKVTTSNGTLNVQPNATITGTDLPRVKVLAGNEPVEGVTILFYPRQDHSADATDQTLFGAVAVTNESGEATLGGWTVGTQPNAVYAVTACLLINAGNQCANTIDFEARTSSASCPFAANPSLVAFYPLNGSGKDCSGNDNNGTIIGSLPTVVGRNGIASTAMSFSGNSHISVPSSTAIKNLTSEMTLVFWVKKGATNITDGMLPVARREFGNRIHFLAYSGTGGFAFQCCSAGGSEPGSYFQANGNGLATINNGAWHQIAMVRKFGTDGFTRLYIDGTLLSGFYSSGTATDVPAVIDAALLIGRQASTSPGQFVGLLDDVMIFNKALTLSEINGIP